MVGAPGVAHGVAVGDDQPLVAELLPQEPVLSLRVQARRHPWAQTSCQRVRHSTPRVAQTLLETDRSLRCTYSQQRSTVRVGNSHSPSRPFAALTST